MLCRLNTPSFRFATGFGGIPDITTQDIAAALGMVRNRFGADVLAYLHCPGMIDETSFEVGLLERLRAECFRQVDEQVNVELRYLLNAGKRHTLENLAAVARNKGARVWPRFEADTFPVYARLILAVLKEVKVGNLCSHCNGTGMASETAGMVRNCQHCAGTGAPSEAQRPRAARMGISQSAFKRTWQEPFQWLLGELVTAMTEANGEFRAALGRKAA
jgi:hypothetical protein